MKLRLILIFILTIKSFDIYCQSKQKPTPFPAAKNPSPGKDGKLPTALPENPNFTKESSKYDSSIYYILDFPIYHHLIVKKKENIFYSNQYLNEKTYIGGSRSVYWGYYDGFTGGIQYGKDLTHLFYEVGFQSNRRFRFIRTKLHFPTMLGINLAVENKFQTFGIHLEAREGLIRKEKYFNMYDLLYVGGVFKVYNNTRSTYSSQTFMPIVSFSPPGRYLNNLLFTYGYNYKIGGKEVVQMNYGHTFTLHYILPDF